MKLLEGFRKLLGQVGQAAGAGVMGGVGKGAVNMMRRPMPQPTQQRVEQPIQARPMMNGQNAQRFVGRERPRYEDEGMVYGPRGPMPLNQIKPGESWMDPDRALRYAEAGGVSEDSAFGYTQDGIEPLTNVGPEKSWQPMYQLPNQEEYYNPFMRLMRKR
jgi:hypothetical protein